MNSLDLVSAFLIGLAGGVHCVGMCGGIASAFSFAIPKQSSLSIYMLSYNLGRILSYTLMGALVGYLGSIVSVNSSFAHTALQLLSIVFLILMALYISDWWRVLVRLERAGALLWQKISPISKRLIPFKNPIYAVVYGSIWGWLPCGLVYSALTWAMASGNGIDGALTMLFFGLGTLPALLAVGLGATMLLPLFQHHMSRKIIAVLLLSYASILIFEQYQSNF